MSQLSMVSMPRAQHDRAHHESSWPIRNCGLMLFRALIDRLLGTNAFGNKTDVDWTCSSAKISYSKYPKLPGLLVSLLNPGSTNADTISHESSQSGRASVQIVFLALDFLRRAGPPVQDYDQIKSLVLHQSGSFVWHVRDLASRTYCGFVPTRDVRSEIHRLLSAPWKLQNTLHGRLMCIKYIVDLAMTRDADSLSGMELPHKANTANAVKTCLSNCSSSSSRLDSICWSQTIAQSLRRHI